MNSHQTIYLDYAATTPVDPIVATKMMGYLTPDGIFANPASRTHRLGWQAEEAVEHARQQVADLVGADPREIVWTSGATESDNLAIKGIAKQYYKKGNHIISSTIEHKAVLDCLAELEKEGFEITLLAPAKKTGMITAEQVKAAITERTILVSLMMVNNEIGTITDVAAIANITKAAGVFFHVDAAQATGKLSIDLTTLPVDLMSFSGHKTYAPKGIGALYVRRTPALKIPAMIHGGKHERGMRSGTLPTHQIVAMGEAYALAAQHMQTENTRLQQLRNKLWQALCSFADSEFNVTVSLNGHKNQHVPNILNVCLHGIEAESFMMALPNIAVATGSACNSATVKPSYVLQALGLSDEDAHSSIRFSMGRFTTEAEIDQVIMQISKALPHLCQ